MNSSEMSTNISRTLKFSPKLMPTSSADSNIKKEPARQLLRVMLPTIYKIFSTESEEKSEKRESELPNS